MPLSRRALLSSLAAGGAAAFLPLRAPAQDFLLGTPEPFGFDTLVERARTLAAEPYHAPVRVAPEVVDRIAYDAHWQIRYRDAASHTVPGTDIPLQLFHPGRFFPDKVRVHLLAGGEARELVYDRSYFDMPADSPAQDLPHDVGFAGFRLMRRGADGEILPDWVSFLGASYFRTDGPEGQYGLSARGIAIDTGLPGQEEFPRFSEFWIGGPERAEEDATVYALLEGPSVTGAFRIGLGRSVDGGPATTRVENRLFFRAPVTRLGIAPLTSMYWYSERDRLLSADWRPEIHDSDGLALHTGAGERIWRPLRNPAALRVSSHVDETPRGFGLSQRDRDFAHYQDDGVFYERRASAWIVPEGDWGRGSVTLVEIPTGDETADNIVAFWTPEERIEPGMERGFSYLLEWRARDPDPDPVARVRATRQGQGGAPGKPIPEGVDKMVIDFEGPVLAGLDASSGVEPVVEISGGRLEGDIAARPVVGTPYWRLSFDFASDPGGPARIRAYLRRDGAPLTETWMTEAVSGRIRPGGSPAGGG